MSGCGFKSSTVLEPATRELSWGDWVSLQSSSRGMPLRLGMHYLFTAGPEMMTLGKRNGGAWQGGGGGARNYSFICKTTGRAFYCIVYLLYCVLPVLCTCCLCTPQERHLGLNGNPNCRYTVNCEIDTQQRTRGGTFSSDLPNQERSPCTLSTDRGHSALLESFQEWVAYCLP